LEHAAADCVAWRLELEGYRPLQKKIRFKRLVGSSKEKLRSFRLGEHCQWAAPLRIPSAAAPKKVSKTCRFSLTKRFA